jgi:hypothetical protein
MTAEIPQLRVIHKRNDGRQPDHATGQGVQPNGPLPEGAHLSGCAIAWLLLVSSFLER